MKKNLLVVLSLSAIAIVSISGTLYSTSSPGKQTGSPMDGGTCVYCHSGKTVIAKEKWISSNIPATGYAPKTTYIISISAEDVAAAKIGFEITAEAAKKKVGTFKILDETKTVFTNNKTAVTHTNAGTIPTNGISTWTVEWTSPDVDSGNITFYAAFNAANGNGKKTEDQIYTSSYVVSQDASTTSVASSGLLKNAVYPNPAYGFVFVESANSIKYISVVDMQGRLVKTISVNGTNKSKVDLFELNKGNYILKTVTSNGEFTKKIQLN